MQRDSFYSSGLRFSCTECSLCCRFDSGYVFLSANDITRLVARFGLSRPEVIERFCRIVDVGVASRITLREQENLDCVFWQHGGCSIYADRPLQCRSYPFWPVHLASRDQWDELQQQCPGVDVGRLHSSCEIENWLERRRAEPFADPRLGR